MPVSASVRQIQRVALARRVGGDGLDLDEEYQSGVHERSKIDEGRLRGVGIGGLARPAGAGDAKGPPGGEKLAGVAAFGRGAGDTPGATRCTTRIDVDADVGV